MRVARTDAMLLESHASPPPLAPAGGFGLIETVVATALLAMAVAAIAHVFALGALAASEARDVTYETVLAMQKVEELRAGAFPDDTADVVEYLDAAGALVDAGGGDGAVRYRRRAVVERWPWDPADAVVITVTVGRNAGLAAQVQLSTLRTRRPM